MSARPGVLCIGGLDPSGGAGLLADAEAVRDAGGRPMAVASAITVQSHRGVFRIAALTPRLVTAQADRVLDDEGVAAVKLGMLADARIARALAHLFERRLGRRHLVIDPVLRSSTGSSLFRGRAGRDYADLFALATAVTPNLAEAAHLLGESIGPSAQAREAACRELSVLLHAGIVLKGGHAGADADDFVSSDGKTLVRLAAKRIKSERRGTGCRFASVLATRLALGQTLGQAARTAKTYVLGYLKAA